MSHSPPHATAENVLAAMMATHWAIQPEALETMISIAERTNLDVEQLERQRGEELKNAYNATTRDGVATLPVTGPLFRYANLFSRVSGATSYEDLARDFTAAVEDPNVRAILLDVNSPGGTVDGNEELAQMVYAARGQKPIVAYVSHLGASAAYFLAAAADEVVVSPTAILGSIGTVATVRKNEKDPKSIEVVSTQSPMKRPDPESAPGRAAIQRTIDALAQVFVERVALYRGVSIATVLSDFGQGDVFVGQAAVRAGLADRLGAYEGLHAELAGAAGGTNGSTFSIGRARTAAIAALRTEANGAIIDAAIADPSCDLVTAKARLYDAKYYDPRQAGRDAGARARAIISGNKHVADNVSAERLAGREIGRRLNSRGVHK